VSHIRSIPSDFDPDMVAAIERRLQLIEAEHDVMIVWAIESGSRAWGFPSPDSDYDCRFIYVRPLAHYLSVHPKRDVIEVPIEEGLDINGWDLFKLAKLLLKGNGAAVEWLMSPIVYGGFEEFRRQWHAQADRFVDRSALARHYYHLGQGQMAKHLVHPDAVSLKKIFYVLRPALALRWLRLHPDRKVPPMHLPTLLEQTAVPDPTLAEISALLALKAVTREMGEGSLPRQISGFIQSEYELSEPLMLHTRSDDASESSEVSAIDNLISEWISRRETLQSFTRRT